MLDQRRRRWINIPITFSESLNLFSAEDLKHSYPADIAPRNVNDLV